MNHWLLELERGGGGDEPVSAVFRAVHTIKGMSATMGYALVAELSHEIESMLDRVRAGSLAIDANVMDLLFRGADVLERAIEAAVAGRERDISADDLLQALRTAALVKQAPRASAPLLVATPAMSSPSGESWTVAAPIGAGLLVRIRLAKETPLRGVRAFLVVQAAKRLGEVTATEPTLSALQGDDFEHDFALRLVTSAPIVEIEGLLKGAGDVVAVHVGEDATSQGNSSAIVLPQDGAVNSASAAMRTSGFLTAAEIGKAEQAAADDPAIRQQRHVRIDLRRLDALMNLIGELVIARGRLQSIAGTLGDASLTETMTLASRLIGDLRDEIMSSRMVPVWQVFDRFPRLVRDAARSLGKQVDFTIEGKEIELDRSMLDEIGEPIVHLLRNAVDHGIEGPEARASAGKPAAGRLRLSALRDRSAVVIRVSDDGKGIDRQRVLSKAKASGLVDATRTDLTDEELVRLISRSGFSTADAVTGISGRGVGVDAVFSRVRSLGGAVDIKTSPGQGTTVTMRLPLTLAILRALLAQVDDEIYAVPLTHVSETVELHAGVQRTLKGREVLLLRDDVLPLLRLRTLVGLPPQAVDSERLEQVVIVEVADRRAGLVVDDLIGQQEIVVKQYDAVRDAASVFSGATILGDGNPALILDVSSLPT